MIQGLWAALNCLQAIVRDLKLICDQVLCLVDCSHFYLLHLMIIYLFENAARTQLCIRRSNVNTLLSIMSNQTATYGCSHRNHSYTTLNVERASKVPHVHAHFISKCLGTFSTILEKSGRTKQSLTSFLKGPESPN